MLTAGLALAATLLATLGRMGSMLGRWTIGGVTRVAAIFLAVLSFTVVATVAVVGLVATSEVAFVAIGLVTGAAVIAAVGGGFVAQGGSGVFTLLRCGVVIAFRVGGAETVVTIEGAAFLALGFAVREIRVAA